MVGLSIIKKIPDYYAIDLLITITTFRRETGSHLVRFSTILLHQWRKLGAPFDNLHIFTSLGWQLTLTSDLAADLLIVWIIS